MSGPRRRIKCSLILLLSFVSESCTNFDNWGHDVPAIRALQKASLERVSSRPIAGRSIADFFRDKVGLIVPENSRFPSGRAVPISSDGYYLTAWHVVDQAGFGLSNFVSLKPLPVGETINADEYYRDDLHPGRVVWKDEKADLAIVKFAFQPRYTFSLASQPSDVGQEVFSAAVGTNSGSLLTSSDSSVGEGVGNGPYQTAGTITRRSQSGRSLRHYRYHSSLIARGGMSGGAVVDDTGNLVGILIQIRASLLSAPRTAFTMIEPARVRQIIAADRGR